MLTLTDFLTGFQQLFYPHTCNGCGTDIVANDNLLCTKCFTELPSTFYAKHAANPVEKIFFGRINIASAHAEFYFSKESLIQNLIHQLKYKGNRQIGIFLGEIMGRTLLESGRFNHIDAVIPLPMFPDKERKRGYNQATVIAEGIAKTMNIPVYKDVLLRKKLTETQTRKHRTERWQNVDGSFTILNEHKIKGSHILLVDDVITTGATLEAGGTKLLQTGEVKLSIATLATATK